MVKDNIAITYSPYNQKFYQGKFDGDGTDFSKDYGMKAIAKLHPDKKLVMVELNKYTMKHLDKQKEHLEVEILTQHL